MSKRKGWLSGLFGRNREVAAGDAEKAAAVDRRPDVPEAHEAAPSAATVLPDELTRPAEPISEAAVGSTPLGRAPIVKSAAAKTVEVDSCAQCSGFRKLGTTVDFAGSAADAGKLADEQAKLIFLLHVSGNFAREEFT